LGDVHDRFVDVRLIAATHHDLAALIEEGRFRSDLYFRISTLLIVIPPLRERVEDIPVIARELLARISNDLRQPRRELSDAAMERLQSHPWPGNIRELRNVLERAALHSTKPLLDGKDLFLEPNAPASNGHYDSKLTMDELEQMHIQRVLKEAMGNVSTAAVRLGIPRSTLYQRIKTLGLGRSS